MRPELTNEQRPFLGLRIIQPHWQREEWLPNHIFYHDNLAIRKIVSYFSSQGPDAFDEADYDIELTPDKLMRTASGRGKPRAITWSNLAKYRPTGYRFFFDGATCFSASTPGSTFQSLKGNGHYTSWARAAQWLDGFISRQSSDYPQQLLARLYAPVPRVSYRPGDIVAFTLSNDSGYGFCRILLSVNHLRQTAWVQDPPEDTGGFHYLNRIVAPLVMAEVLKLQKQTSEISQAELLGAGRYPPFLLADTYILNGCLPIVAHQKVKAEHLQQLPQAFEQLYYCGPKGWHYQWGIASVVVPDDPELRQFGESTLEGVPSRSPRPLADFDVETYFPHPEKHFRFLLGQDEVEDYDLRHSRYQLLREMILHRLGLFVKIDYDEFSKHFGFPTRQEVVKWQDQLPASTDKTEWW